MKNKTRWLVIALLIFCTGLLAGCSEDNESIVQDSEQEKAEAEVQLSVFGFKYEALNVKAIEDTLHDYMEEHPEVFISYDGIKGPEYFDVLEKRIASGNGDDIFMVDHERVLKLSAEGKLADLSDLSTLGDFSKLAKSQMNATGTVWYVPTSISAFGLYCNEDLLKEHGQDIPENLKEFTEVCDYFVSEGITPIVANNDISLKTIAIAKGMLPVYQSDDPAARIQAMNTGEEDLAETLRPGFELVEKMINRKWVNAEEALTVEKTKDDLTIFAEGKQPFMLTGAWATPRVKALDPDFSFVVQPYPILKKNSVLVINVDTRISINAESPDVEEAKEFLEYLTRKDVIWDFANSQSSFSPMKDNRLAEDESIQAIGPYLNNGYSVLGSDDTLQYPIWDQTKQCIQGMLEGDDSDAAVERMRQLILEWREAEQKE
ncbi:MAG: ABC transporter substrate-binding protein [Bacillota bacterium]|nr:ABC transporter substrate-binding protein [Bacillota bacterium]